MSAIDLTNDAVREFRDQILGICLDHPKRKNPTAMEKGVSRCLYVDKEDPTLHCIIGEWVVRYRPEAEDQLAQFDTSMPDGSAGALLRHLGEDDVAATADLVQTFADDYGKPRKWKHVARRLLADAKVLVDEKGGAGWLSH